MTEPHVALFFDGIVTVSLVMQGRIAVLQILRSSRIVLLTDLPGLIFRWRDYGSSGHPPQVSTANSPKLTPGLCFILCFLFFFAISLILMICKTFNISESKSNIKHSSFVPTTYGEVPSHWLRRWRQQLWELLGDGVLFTSPIRGFFAFQKTFGEPLDSV